MIVTSTVDLSEGGKTPLPEGQTMVLIFASDDNHDLDGAFAAIGRCRLIREGHVFNTEIQHALNGWLLSLADYELAEDGEVYPRPTTPDKHGNLYAREGVDRCVCGSKYWERDRCVDCLSAPPRR